MPPGRGRRSARPLDSRVGIRMAAHAKLPEEMKAAADRFSGVLVGPDHRTYAVGYDSYRSGNPGDRRKNPFTSYWASR
jgi:hypothetical protein